MERVVVVGGQFAAIRIEHPQSEVKLPAAVVHVGETHGIDLGGEPRACDGGQLQEVGRATLVPADRDVGHDRERRGDGVMRLAGLVHHREGRDVKRGQRGELVGRAEAEEMLAGRAVGGDHESALHLFLDPAAVGQADHMRQLGQRLDPLGLDAGPREDHLAGLLEPRPLDRHLDRRAPLADPGRDPFNVLEQALRRSRTGRREPACRHNSQERCQS